MSALLFEGSSRTRRVTFEDVYEALYFEFAEVNWATDYAINVFAFGILDPVVTIEADMGRWVLRRCGDEVADLAEGTRADEVVAIVRELLVAGAR